MDSFKIFLFLVKITSVVTLNYSFCYLCNLISKSILVNVSNKNKDEGESETASDSG